MRPVTTKPKPQPEAQSLDPDSDESDGIEETQGSKDAQDVEDGSCEILDEPTEDECASDYGDDSHTPKKRKTQPKKKTDTKQIKDLAATKDEGTVKKAARKVSASAHANYRRLKIKSKNSKGQGKGHFGRRR